MRLNIYKIFTINVIILILISCQSKQELTSNQPDLGEIPDQEGWNATLTTTSDGTITYKIKYVHMQRYSNKKIIKFDEGVEIDFYDTKGSHTSKVYSNKAELNEINKNIDLIGKVRVLSDDGLTLNTEKLRWNESNGKILSDVFVTMITTEKDTINGIGFESKKSLKNWVIKQPSGVTQKKLNLKILDTDAKNKANERK
ncbi:MAG: LPS export ABC transporter periplasmic protein LptC [bacterium]